MLSSQALNVASIVMYRARGPFSTLSDPMEAITSFLRSISSNKADASKPGEAPAASKAQSSGKQGDHKPSEKKEERKPEKRGEKPAAEAPAKPPAAKPAPVKPQALESEPKPEAKAKEEAKGKAESAASTSVPADLAPPPIRVVEDVHESMDRCGTESAHRVYALPA